jgi:hypothetical protein
VFDLNLGSQTHGPGANIGRVAITIAVVLTAEKATAAVTPTGDVVYTIDTVDAVDTVIVDAVADLGSTVTDGGIEIVTILGLWIAVTISVGIAGVAHAVAVQVFLFRVRVKLAVVALSRTFVRQVDTGGAGCRGYHLERLVIEAVCDPIGRATSSRQPGVSRQSRIPLGTGASGSPPGVVLSRQASMMPKQAAISVSSTPRLLDEKLTPPIRKNVRLKPSQVVWLARPKPPAAKWEICSSCPSTQVR